MNIETKIWYDLVHTKHGDEYLILYLARQRSYRKWFKIITIVFSASGIFSTFQSAQIPTIISFIVIGIIQLMTSIENFIIHSEDDLDNISKLRMLYYDKLNDLEKLWHLLKTKKILIEDATEQFFELRKSFKEAEELDNKINVRTYKKLKNKSNIITNNYLKTYYYE